MALPKIQHPIFEVKLPTSQTKVKIRPMLVKEEKILLVAKQSGERLDQLNAIKQVVTNCLVDTLVVDNMPYVDLEYLFLKIREFSVSNIAKVAYVDNEDKKTREFEIDLAKVQVKFDDTQNGKIDLGNGIGLVLKLPSVRLYTSKSFFDQKDEEVFEYMILACIDKIVESDKVYDIKQVDQKDLKDFVESVPSKNYAQIQEYFQKIPTLYHKIEYTNDNGTKREIELKTLEDFFTF